MHNEKHALRSWSDMQLGRYKDYIGVVGQRTSVHIQHTVALLWILENERLAQNPEKEGAHSRILHETAT